MAITRNGLVIGYRGWFDWVWFRAGWFWNAYYLCSYIKAAAFGLGDGVVSGAVVLARPPAHSPNPPTPPNPT